MYEDRPQEIEQLEASEAEASLSDLVQRWLERTPGLDDDFNFPKKYKQAIDAILSETLEKINVRDDDWTNYFSFRICCCRCCVLKKKIILCCHSTAGVIACF